MARQDQIGTSDDVPSTAPERKPSVVRRPNTLAVQSYGEYKQQLRVDFWFSCAYCTLTEMEAAGVGFEIDHYLPVAARPDLELDYSNLMWSCEQCNRLKGDLLPPETGMLSGRRFFRPDSDAFLDHFQLSIAGNPPMAAYSLLSLTKIGEFTTRVLLLNSTGKRRVRELRHRLHRADQIVAGGLRELLSFSLDTLPMSYRASLLKSRSQLGSAADEMTDCIESLVSDLSRSPLLDAAPDAADAAFERRRYLEDQRALCPGTWRGRQVRKSPDKV